MLILRTSVWKGFSPLSVYAIQSTNTYQASMESQVGVEHKANRRVSHLALTPGRYFRKLLAAGRFDPQTYIVHFWEPSFLVHSYLFVHSVPTQNLW